MHEPARTVNRQVWRDGGQHEGARTIPEETALALTYNGGTYAVMMGTPQNLTDFAIGFSLSEGVVQTPEEIQSIEIVDLDEGIELRMWLADEKASRISERRRQIAGPTGCGLCGIDSITEALRPAAIVSGGRNFGSEDIMAAMQSIAPLQTINIETRAVHAAAFWLPGRGIVALREDVGRHNALDKLIGQLVLDRADTRDGFVFLSSRASYELVRKAARVGVPMIATISAPSSLAIAIAKKANLRLVSFCRETSYVDYGTR
jgi:FdhD protein